MSFTNPGVLWLVLLVPAAVWLFAYAARRRAEALQLFFGGQNAAQENIAARMARVRRWRGFLAVLSLGLFVVALAGPRYGTAVREARQESLDLVVAMDVSSSMLTEDVAPNRLQRARLTIAQLVEQREGDRIGLVVFAGDAFLQCPLTTDRSAFRLFLDAAGPDLVSTPGTDFGNALRVAASAMATDTEGGPARPRVIVVVSDGEDHEGQLDDAVDALRGDGVLLLALGVGTEAGGPIPVYRRGERVGFKTDENGEQVTSRLEEGVLREIAGRDGLVLLGAGDDVGEISAHLDRLDRIAVDTERYESYSQRFQWPLALALLALFGERMLSLRRVGRPERKSLPGASAPIATARRREE